MDSNINLSQFIGKYFAPKVQHLKTHHAPTLAPTQTPATPQQTTTPQSTNFTSQQAVLMGSSENANYVREMMQLPQNFNALIYIIQKNMTNAQLQAQLNQNLLANRQISQTQAQILAQLQGLNFAEFAQTTQINQTLLKQLEANLRQLTISANGTINIADIANLIKANGKDAITQIIIGMANATKNGITDVSQMKEVAKLINASVAVASQKDNAQTLKMLMLLYLPWLPLQEGQDFELEITTKDENNSDNSVLIIKIQTIHYGEITATLTLEKANAVSVDIKCSEEFPKDELTLRLNGENKHYSAMSAISYSETTQTKPQIEKAQATINMSNTNEINPYLLLIAHQIIRHVVDLDRQ